MSQLDTTGGKSALPTVSIVMPNYNHGHLVEEALAAALSQSVPPLEVLVLDDGSTDDSVERIKRLAAQAPTVLLMAYDRNLGVVSRMRQGLREARGDFVLFAAADDRLDTQIVKRAMVAAAEIPDIGVVFSDPAELNDETGVTCTYPLHLSDRALHLPPKRMADLLRRFVFYPSVGNVFFNRKHLSSIGFEEELRWHADYFAFYVMAFRHGACYVPEALSYFRVQSCSYSSGARRSGERSSVLSAWFLRLKADDMADVRPIFRNVPILPAYFPGVVGLAAKHGFLTPSLLRQVFIQSTWNALRGWMPDCARRLARRIRGRLGRGSLRPFAHRAD